MTENNGAAESTTYYFRMVYSDGSGLNTYSAYPQLGTASGASVLTQLEYRWYQNADAVQPTTPLAAEDSPLIGSAVYHLRMNVQVTVANLDPGPTFRLQYAATTSGPWTDVGGLGSGLELRGYDNPTPTDGSTVSSNLLIGSHAPAKQTYEEVNPSAATPNSIGKGKAGEWGWLVENNGAAPGITFYLRMVRGDGSPLDGYTTYPEIATAGVTITPNNSSSSSPDSVVSYTHTVTNTGIGNDTFDITFSSSEGWTVALYEVDGITPLADTDADTVPDTGSLAPSASVNIVVKVTVGWNALSDTTSVTSTSSVDLAVSATATDATTAPPTITLTLSDATMALGTPDPTCEGLADGAPTGEFTVYSGTAGNQGCSYVWNDLDVTVQSNKAWSGTVAGTDGSPTSGVTVPQGSFRYDVGTPTTSYAGCASNTALTTTASPFEPSGGVGDNQVYTYHHCVLVDWDDDDGTIDSTITYTVQQ